MWPSFTSVTTNRDIAVQFSENGFLFELSGIDDSVSANIDQLSLYPSEEEILLIPGISGMRS